MARATGAGKSPTAKRPAKKSQSPARFPKRYSHAYPSGHGHHYMLNAIPMDVWERAKKRAHGEERSIRVVLISALELYGSGRLNL